MRISNNPGKGPTISSAGSSKKEENKQVLGLKKSEVLSDLFNNSSPKNEANGSVRLRISHTSKALYKNLKNQIQEFLSLNKGVSKALESIPVDVEEGKSVAGSDLTVRRFMIYHQWLKVLEQEEQVVQDAESEPFRKVQLENQDEAIKELFQKHADYQKEAVHGRLKTSPNYYYIIHPETYSFN